MKKIFTTLVALLIVGIGFAQTDVKSLTPGMELPSTIKQQPNTLNIEKGAKSAASFWYSYASGMANYSPSTTTGNKVLSLFTDSVASMIYGVGPSNPDSTILLRPQVYSTGMVYDFTSQMWNYFYDNFPVDGPRIEVPYLGTEFSCGKTYSIDSIHVALMYLRGSEVPAEVVDTLVISVGVVAAEYTGLVVKNADGEVLKSWNDIKNLTYDHASACLASGNTIFGNSFQVIKLPLTENDAHNKDTTLGADYFFALDETKFQNLNKRQLVMTAGMISGIPRAERDTNMEIGKELSHLRIFYYEDGRSPFDQSPTSIGSGWATETNLPITAGETLFGIPIIEGRYTSDAIWTSPARRYLFSALVTCEDCCIINVKDLEKTNKNITVRPNPATNNFTVELDDNSQAQVQLFNLLGQAVYNEQTNNQTVTVNVSNFNSGVYMLKVTQNGKVYTSKVLVQ